MKKRVTSFLLAILALVILTLPVLAADDVEPLEEIPESAPDAGEAEEETPDSLIYLDGQPALTVEYESINGVCYVTISSFVTALDPEAVVEEEDGVVRVYAATVTEVIPADENGETANVVTADLNLTAAAGDKYLTANDRFLYAPDGLILLDGRVAAPVRLMSRVFNLTVGYDAENNLVLVDHQEGEEPYLACGDSFYDSEVLYWLSRIIYCESGNQRLEGKIAVGNVVMNRVNSPNFPNTITEVLFQKNQFYPADSKAIRREPNAQSVLAAKLVMDGAVVTPTALFFNTVGLNCYASRHRTFVTTIGAHSFYE